MIIGIMEFTNIRLFLQTFTDQKLANMQAACEDGGFNVMSPCKCLIGFAGDNTNSSYRVVKGCDSKFPTSLQRLAEAAELEALGAGDNEGNFMLPLIVDEWARRAATRAANQPTEVTVAATR